MNEVLFGDQPHENGVLLQTGSASIIRDDVMHDGCSFIYTHRYSCKLTIKRSMYIPFSLGKTPDKNSLPTATVKSVGSEDLNVYIRSHLL
jgi:hypothetical protein